MADSLLPLKPLYLLSAQSGAWLEHVWIPYLRAYCTQSPEWANPTWQVWHAYRGKTRGSPRYPGSRRRIDRPKPRSRVAGLEPEVRKN